MKGLEISERFWEEYGKPLFEERFPDDMEKIAVGLTGSGSECWGFDDEISRDHDFEAGFCVFLPDENEVSRRTEFLMERAYASLPEEYMGLKRSRLSPVGGNRHGIFRTADYFLQKTGVSGIPGNIEIWLSLPDSALAEVCNGRVFTDGFDEFSRIRNYWRNPPEDIVLKKLTGFLISMSQTGEYNYPRCLQRGDKNAALMTAQEFIKAAMGAFFWMNGKPVPYYKWCFRALGELPGSEPVYSSLEKILCGEDTALQIELLCSLMPVLLKEKGIITGEPTGLQNTAFSLNSRIKDGNVRNMSLLAAI